MADCNQRATEDWQQLERLMNNQGRPPQDEPPDEDDEDDEDDDEDDEDE
jgi:hypothetical protein